MTIAATEATATVRLPRLDWPFLIASMLATAVMIALVADRRPACRRGADRAGLRARRPHS